MPARPSHTSAVIIAIGIIVAAIVAPVAATAAGQLVEISSVSGRRADVTRAEQLQVAEASPHQFVRARGEFTTGSGCVNLYTAPSTKAIVVKSLQLNIRASDGNDWINLYVLNGGCGGSSSEYFDSLTITSRAPVARDYEPGIVVPAGSTLIATRDTALWAVVWLNGYKVPSTAVTG